tara:strand:+ start:826 stop:1773 length:948 start_codon:yes stop_codon:yes gene_type:complete
MISDIAHYLPSKKLTNKELSHVFENFSSTQISDKVGIDQRSISGFDEFSSDLASKAIERLFAKINCDRSLVDFLIVCTQTPDYLLPSTSAIVQRKSKLNIGCGAIDINQGCSGYIYSLATAKALLENNTARKVLLVTSDTYSKLLDSKDRSTRSIFGDAATATLLKLDSETKIGKFVFGTDGRGSESLLAYNSGMKIDHEKSKYLFMDGPEIFKFTINVIPELVNEILNVNQCDIEEIDYFVFHQANAFMLEHLRKKLDLDKKKFLIAMKDCGNTVSSSIPLLVENLIKKKSWGKVLLCGFGVGYSWGGTILCRC